MDATDAKIVQALQRDGRQRLADLSETVGLSAAALPGWRKAA